MVSTTKPWITTSEYVDTETGEIIAKRQALKHYIILRKSKKYDQSKHYNVTKWTYECGRDPQQKLF